MQQDLDLDRGTKVINLGGLEEAIQEDHRKEKGMIDTKRDEGIQEATQIQDQDQDRDLDQDHIHGPQVVPADHTGMLCS